ncbi:uncharacterized protein N7479_008974 [Penicillium vulpinum]|uniref:uncharacterized protein n=1 Tax=Penicillium vulpinum TaxID=29845 RepID=UPI002546B007|nr:uncharacterized protein N7479_008974 [Penicillium vulpinum]KAJ5950561.1 hypothetical protein N7479_008974 [Penicillium vulpinum]
MTESGCSYGSEVGGFLDDLPPFTNRYIYEGKEQLDQIMEIEHHRLAHSRAESLKISEYFQRFLRPDPIPGLRLFYNPALQILILRSSSLEHLQAAGALHDTVTETLRPMGLHHALLLFGGANVDVGDGQVKGPDWGWCSRRPPLGVAKRPGVVVEVGVSEPETKLCNDARFWVDPTKGKANMAITIKVDRRKPELKLNTREWNSHLQRPHITQFAIVEKYGDEITVSESPLVIPFHHIFQRAPEHSKEKDIQHSKEQLTEWATSVWDAQEL